MVDIEVKLENLSHIPFFKAPWFAFLLATLLCVAPGAIDFFSRVSEKTGITILAHATWLTNSFAIAFFVLTVFAFYQSTLPPKDAWNADDVEGEIDQPPPFKKCPEKVAFSGTLTKELPPNSHIWLLRRLFEDGPLLADAEMTLKNKKKIWYGTGNVGGQPGKGHVRWFEVWAVGEVTHRHFEHSKRNEANIYKKCSQIGVSNSQFYDLKTVIGVNTNVGDAKLIASTIIQRE